jgi:CspA family cold shock protein
MAPLRLEGLVSSFDEAIGLGEITIPEPAHTPAGRYPFHCTQIADGSRVVEVGARVSFRLLAGRDGRWEAADIRPVGDAPAAPSPPADMWKL